MEIYKRNIEGKGRELLYPEIDLAVDFPLKLPIWLKKQVRKKYGRDAAGIIKELLIRHGNFKRPK